MKTRLFSAPPSALAAQPASCFWSAKRKAASESRAEEKRIPQAPTSTQLTSFACAIWGASLASFLCGAFPFTCRAKSSSSSSSSTSFRSVKFADSAVFIINRLLEWILGLADSPARLLHASSSMNFAAHRSSFVSLRLDFVDDLNYSELFDATLEMKFDSCFASQ